MPMLHGHFGAGECLFHDTKAEQGAKPRLANRCCDFLNVSVIDCAFTYNAATQYEA